MLNYKIHVTTQYGDRGDAHMIIGEAARVLAETLGNSRITGTVVLTDIDRDDRLGTWQAGPTEEEVWAAHRAEVERLRDEGDIAGALRLVLYPPHDPDGQWDADTLDAIADLVRNPEATACKRCGTPLSEGCCGDQTCPYSDHPQNANIDWG